jgi:hypothetical protein
MPVYYNNNCISNYSEVNTILIDTTANYNDLLFIVSPQYNWNILFSVFLFPILKSSAILMLYRSVSVDCSTETEYIRRDSGWLQGMVSRQAKRDGI